MTRFVHLNYANEHPGVQRAQAVADAAGRFRRSFDSTKGLAAMLLAALVAALMVVADQLVSVWADGYLLASWVTLWAIAFTALALMAPTAHRLASSLSAAWKRRAIRVANERSDAKYWASAQSDPRVMADLQAAILRSEHAQTGPGATGRLGAKISAPAGAAMGADMGAHVRAVLATTPATRMGEPVNPIELEAALEQVYTGLPPAKRYLRYV